MSRSGRVRSSRDAARSAPVRATRAKAPAAPDTARSDSRSAGHQFGGISVQPKLEVGAVDDPFEQEADRVADEVVSMEDASAVGEDVDASPPQIQRMCAECEEEQGPQLSPEPGAQLEQVPDLEARIASLQGSGKPLADEVRQSFERRIGRDFGDVRVHTSERAATTAKALGARAFTLGRDIAFAPGQFSPESTEGRRLLAHELTHVVQQTSPAPRAPSAEAPVRPSPLLSGARREDEEETP